MAHPGEDAGVHHRSCAQRHHAGTPPDECGRTLLDLQVLRVAAALTAAEKTCASRGLDRRQGARRGARAQAAGLGEAQVRPDAAHPQDGADDPGRRRPALLQLLRLMFLFCQQPLILLEYDVVALLKF